MEKIRIHHFFSMPIRVHVNADPDPDPTLSFTHAGKTSNFLAFLHNNASLHYFFFVLSVL
jgi:hypothetical protein